MMILSLVTLPSTNNSKRVSILASMLSIVQSLLWIPVSVSQPVLIAVVIDSRCILLVVETH